MKNLWIVCVLLLALGCANADRLQEEVDAYLEEYNLQFQRLAYESSKAEWASNTMIVEGDTTNAYRTRMANEAFAAYTGSKENIEKATQYLAKKEKLLPLQVKQLEKSALQRRGQPPDRRGSGEGEDQSGGRTDREALRLRFQDRRRVRLRRTRFDDILKLETNLDKRLEVWSASKEIGPTLKDGLVELRRLRNETVRALGYSDYFAYQVSDYGMTRGSFARFSWSSNRQLRPLYRELHTYARYELAKKYGRNGSPRHAGRALAPQPVGQDWNTMVTVEGLDLDGCFARKPPSGFRSSRSVST